MSAKGQEVMTAQPLVWIGGLLVAAHLLKEKVEVKKVFISFDFDNDVFLKEALVGQAKNSEVGHRCCYVWATDPYRDGSVCRT
jgi:hypothetical protein